MGEGESVTKDDIRKAELKVGHRVFVSGGRPQFIGEVVRFRGKPLGWYTADSSTDDSRLERKVIAYSLYECPGGYRAARIEIYYQRRRERSRWTKKEALTSLLPTVPEDNADQNEQTSGYGVYTDSEGPVQLQFIYSEVCK